MCSAGISLGPVALRLAVLRMARATSGGGCFPNILVQYLSLLHRGTSLHNTLSTCLRFVQLQSNFRQSLTGYIADVAGGAA